MKLLDEILRGWVAVVSVIRKVLKYHQLLVQSLIAAVYGIVWKSLQRALDSGISRWHEHYRVLHSLTSIPRT
jgi:hypothetical protein